MFKTSNPTNYLLLQDYQLLAPELEAQDHQTCLGGESQQRPRGSKSTMTAFSNQTPVFPFRWDRMMVYGSCCGDGKGSDNLIPRDLIWIHL